MSFLAPLFLLGALAVAAPIIFHLIRRTTRERMPFSSLMFLQPTPPRVTRRSRLENIFLLILRCLVLCLLALGFARPFFQKPVEANLGGAPPSRIVLLVDASASMRRDPLWSAAQTKVEAILRKTSPADQVALFTFDQQVHRLINFEQWSGLSAGDRVAVTARRLAETTPSWADTHLGNALIAAAEAFEEAGKGEQIGGPRRIIVISDLQEGSRLDGLQGYEWPRGLELLVEPVKAKRPTNAGLQLVTDRDEGEKATADTGPRVRVSNSTDAKREQFQVGWGRAGEKGFNGTPLDVYVPPGQSRAVTSPKMVGEGERLVLSGDDEDFDNTVYVVPPKAEQVNILFLGNDAEKDSTQLLYYLKRAFQQTHRQDVRILAHAADVPLAAKAVTDTQLMIVTDPLSEERVGVAQNFLKDGKTVLFAMKTTAAAPVIGRLAGLAQFPAEEAPSDRYALLGQIDFEHPLFAPFADPRFSDFTKIHFWKHRRIATDSLPGAKILARFDDRDAALVQLAVGKGTLLILTSGWQPADSQLALSSKFVPLLYSMLEQSGGIKARLAQYVVGDPVPLPRDLAAGAPKLTLRKPDGASIELLAGESKFSQADMPGIYTVTSVQPPFRFAVNLAPEESKTAPLATEELQRLGVPLKAEGVLTAKQVARKELKLRAAELENRQKLWRWLIVAALAVVLLETWLGGWLTRRSTTVAAS
jgi:hypothetical protein